MKNDHGKNPRMESEAWIEDGILKINLQISTISHAARCSEYFYACRESGHPLEIRDEATFAMSVKRALNEESEDGSTPITRMLDAAFRAVVDSGADGVEATSIQPAEAGDSIQGERQ